MSEPAAPSGSVLWADITVEKAEELRDFYAAVCGWGIEPVPMGGYDDFSMTNASGTAVAGVCHARGVNADLPPSWLMYVTVADLDQSIEACRQFGGSVIAGPKPMGSQRLVVLKDPTGAVIALVG